MGTIAYDRPIRDLIAALDATGHVTHSKHKKTHVTLHHNGGILSHDGVLQVWQIRPASAHFDVDASGDVAQYVRADEYAWATGSTVGNQTSISIEMCNQSGPPNWVVSEVTWRSAGRLAGWLFAHEIRARPTRDTLVRHKWWSPTDCAGPHIDNVYDQILATAQNTFDLIVNGSIFEEEGNTNMVGLIKGDAHEDIFLVEVNGEGASKKHLKTTQLVQVFEGLLGTPVRVIPQWKIDFIASSGEIG